MEQTKYAVLTRSPVMRPMRYSGSRWPTGRGSTTRPPTVRGQVISKTEASKLNELFWRTPSPARRPCLSCIHASRFTDPRCGFITPLGRPVLPEV